MSLMVNGPQPGDESYEQYVAEKKEILASLRRRAHMMTVHAAAENRRPSGPHTCCANHWLCGRPCLRSLFYVLHEVANP